MFVGSINSYLDELRCASHLVNQYEFQEPKLEVPTIYKAYIRSVLGVDHFMVSQGSLAVLLALAAILTTPVAAEIFGNWVIAMVLGECEVKQGCNHGELKPISWDILGPYNCSYPLIDWNCT